MRPTHSAGLVTVQQQYPDRGYRNGGESDQLSFDSESVRDIHSLYTTGTGKSTIP